MLDPLVNYVAHFSFYLLKESILFHEKLESFGVVVGRVRTLLHLRISGESERIVDKQVFVVGSRVKFNCFIESVKREISVVDSSAANELQIRQAHIGILFWERG